MSLYNIFEELDLINEGKNPQSSNIDDSALVDISTIMREELFEDTDTTEVAQYNPGCFDNVPDTTNITRDKLDGLIWCKLQDYSLASNKSGIYIIKNINKDSSTGLINNHLYVGKATNLSQRLRVHCRAGQNDSPVLHAAITKYGVENFVYSILKFVKDYSELNYWEKYYIKQLNTYINKEDYNLTPGGDGGGESDLTPIAAKILIKALIDFKEQSYQKIADELAKNPDFKLAGTNTPIFTHKTTVSNYDNCTVGGNKENNNYITLYKLLDSVADTDAEAAGLLQYLQQCLEKKLPISGISAEERWENSKINYNAQYPLIAITKDKWEELNKRGWVKLTKDGRIETIKLAKNDYKKFRSPAELRRKYGDIEKKDIRKVIQNISKATVKCNGTIPKWFYKNEIFIPTEFRPDRSGEPQKIEYNIEYN